MFRRGIICLALVLGAVPAVQAQTAAKPQPKGPAGDTGTAPPGGAVVEKIIAKIMLMDTNKDGKISREEAKGKVAENFDKIDSNSDGFLDREEVRRLAQIVAKTQGGEAKTPPSAEVEKIVAKIMLMDANKDGKISRAEATGKIAENFDKIDANGDGFLDRAEVRKLAENLARFQKGANPPGGGPEAALPDFDALDKNADGRLTREELEGTPYSRQFDQIDANRDGRIDRREFEGFFRKKQK